MANYRVTGAFSHAGIYHEIGDVIDSTSPLVSSHASKLTLDVAESEDITFADGKGPCINSTDGVKVFRVTVNDAGTLAAVEVV